MKRSALFATLLAVTGVTTRMDAQILTTAQAMQLPSKEADHRLYWGLGELQFGDLRLPAGPGPHPVVVLIHGGCWQSEYRMQYMGALGDALKEEGIATWNIEYRSVGDAGGGWPGTMLDVGAAIDDLRFLATKFPLDLDRVVLSGHSAGGQLALWAASRPGAAADNPLRGESPLAVHGVVALSPVADLAASVSDETPICGRSAARLLGGTPTEVPERYALASPSALLPLSFPYAIVSGVDDQFVPAAHVATFANQARRAGDAVRLELVPEAGHFEVVAPGTVAFAVTVAFIRAMVGGGR